MEYRDAVPSQHSGINAFQAPHCRNEFGSSVALGQRRHTCISTGGPLSRSPILSPLTRPSPRLCWHAGLLAATSWIISAFYSPFFSDFFVEAPSSPADHESPTYGEYIPSGQLCHITGSYHQPQTLPTTPYTPSSPQIRRLISSAPQRPSASDTA
jgi:hypothetical protein